MDLLFSEYASPFVLLDNIIGTGRFLEFIQTFDKQRNVRKRWEYYLNKLPSWDDTTWEEFNEKLDAQSMDDWTPISEEQLEATVSDSVSMLQNFNPENAERG